MSKLSFAEFLKQSLSETSFKQRTTGRFNDTGYYSGNKYPHNDQSVGDVTGGTIYGDTGMDHPQSENEEELSLDVQDEQQPPEQEKNLPSDDSDDATGDPDKQGIIRVVKGAHLVYKRETEDGTYEELWVYKTGNPTRDEYKIRKDILAGTDIAFDKMSSEDNAQTYELWTSGNVQMIKIDGLPN
jgi:hypothetical protein